MAFITKDDFNTIIRAKVLDDVIAFDDSKLEATTNEVVGFVSSYLASRYDTDAIFAATGEDRHATVLMICKDIALYNLHCNINPRKIPKLRYDRYQDAISWLEKVSKQEINPPGLPLPADGSKSYIVFGGNTKRDNQY